MNSDILPDPFKEARLKKGYGEMNDQDDPVVIVLRHEDIRQCAKNWQSFQSGAVPGRIVVPSEVNIRDTRQIPFEVDPPEHKSYRLLVEEWFRRPLLPEYKEALTQQIESLVDEVLSKDSVEVIQDFSLPLQSRALTLLLNMPYSEAETWISWGTHVFRSEGDPLDNAKANVLYDYIETKLDHATEHPGEDLFSVLLNADYEDRKLTREEINGILILTFAGGRDTVINALTNSIAYFAHQPEALQRLREEPEIVNKAVEELFRYFAPLTHMGRVVTEDTQVSECPVQADSRISLCWASANRDEAVFVQPNEIILDRKMNPHLSFGFAHHRCLGATHARQIMRILLATLARKVHSIDIEAFKENIEDLGEFQRKVGYHELSVSFTPLT